MVRRLAGVRYDRTRIRLRVPPGAATPPGLANPLCLVNCPDRQDVGRVYVTGGSIDLPGSLLVEMFTASGGPPFQSVAGLSAEEKAVFSSPLPLPYVPYPERFAHGSATPPNPPPPATYQQLHSVGKYSGLRYVLEAGAFATGWYAQVGVYNTLDPPTVDATAGNFVLENLSGYCLNATDDHLLGEGMTEVASTNAPFFRHFVTDGSAPHDLYEVLIYEG